MLEANSQNLTVVENQTIRFNNLSLKKGCTAELVTPTTVQFNKCGVYMISCDVSAGASSTIQLYKDGTAQPQARSTGTTPGFTTLVVAESNNYKCPSSLPTTVQVICETAGTLTDAEIVVTKVC